MNFEPSESRPALANPASDEARFWPGERPAGEEEEVLTHDNGQGAAPAAHLGLRRHLTAREEQMLRFLCQGYSNNEIARSLALSVKTVEGHLARVYTKLSVRSRSQAVAYAIRHQMDAHVEGLLLDEA